MDGYREYFGSKRITLMGLGLLGRGVGDVEFLAMSGATIVVTDKKSEHELAASLEKLERYPNVAFHLGGHRILDFTDTDLVIKAAGVPLHSPEIAAAKEAGVPVAMSTALFAKFAMDAGATIVGITGTRGKSTIAHMIFHSLHKAGKRTFLGGNIRGLSTLAMLPEIKKGDIAVLELDSWQLQGFGDLQISPHVAVFTNLMRDHQNYYPDMDTYFRDKANIFKYQKASDVLVAGAGIAERIRASHPPLDPIVPENIPSDWSLQILGEHNRENASGAVAALQALGLGESEIKAGVESFAGVEGRLQFVREMGGVQIYNDNNATTPEATIAALHALEGNITLITGGSEKGLALDELVSEIKKRVSNVILLTHPDYKGSVRLAESLQKAGIAYEEAHGLRSAVGDAMKNTTSGSIVFSPAFASFGMFKNEYDRNDQFLEIVRAL